MSDTPTETGSGTKTSTYPDAGKPGTPPDYGTVEPPSECLKSGTVEQIIECLTKVLEKAQQEKKKADGTFAEADGLLTAMRTVQEEAEKAKRTYEAAYKQLKIDQRGYADYAESETESLGELIGQAGVEAVQAALRRKTEDDEKAKLKVTTKKVEAEGGGRAEPPWSRR